MPDPISWAYSWPYYASTLVLAYILGSIPVGLILVRYIGKSDIRKIGSGSIGATNVLRTGNKIMALATLLLDAGKGVGAVLIGVQYGPDLALAAGVGVVVGHIAPIWLIFRGGKGVATSLGVVLAIEWQLGLIASAIWLSVAILTRYSSLASLIAVISSPCVAYFLSGRQLCEFSALLATVIIIKHSSNVVRLVKGTESKIKLHSHKNN